MERNEINEFIENLREEKNLSETEASELKESLEISAKDIEPARLAFFIKAVKDEINAPASTVFSERGVNVENIKGIAKSVAKTVKKQQEIEMLSKNKESERSETEKEFDELLKENLEEAMRNNNEEAILKHTNDIMDKYDDIQIGTAIAKATMRAEIESIVDSYYDIKQPTDGKKIDSPKISGDSEAEKRLKVAESLELFQNRIISSKTPEERGKNIRAASLFFYDYRKSDGNIFLDKDVKSLYDPKTQKYSDAVRKQIDRHSTKYSDIMMGVNYSEEDLAINSVEDVSITPVYMIQRILEGFGNKQIIEIFDSAKAKNYIKAKQSVDYEIAKLDQAIEERRQDKYIDGNDLPELVVKRIEQARLRKKACEDYALLPSNIKSKINDSSMDRENTLLTDQEKRKMISDLYFDKGLSAVEIYEMMKTKKIISGDTYLIPDDVIDVVLEEGKRFGLDIRQLQQLQVDEREIENQWAKGIAYRTIKNNARDNHLQDDSARASNMQAKCNANISVLKVKNKDLREIVRQAKAEMETSDTKLVVENVVTSDSVSKFGGMFGKHNFSNILQDYSDNRITNKDVTEQAKIAKELEIVRKQRDLYNKNPSPNRDDDDEIIE